MISLEEEMYETSYGMTTLVNKNLNSQLSLGTHSNRQRKTIGRGTTSFTNEFKNLIKNKNPFECDAINDHNPIQYTKEF